ncbi:hypothetical protein HK098_005189 [Nowakowskiella sp. JEL0407]|nr:hypothetical protein HK098_005189 [Nowakowskiella sp. JEL0407]
MESSSSSTSNLASPENPPTKSQPKRKQMKEPTPENNSSGETKKRGRSATTTRKSKAKVKVNETNDDELDELTQETSDYNKSGNDRTVAKSPTSNGKQTAVVDINQKEDSDSYEFGKDKGKQTASTDQPNNVPEHESKKSEPQFPALGSTLTVLNGIIQSKSTEDGEVITATSDHDDENDDPPKDTTGYPQGVSPAAAAAAANLAAEAWMKEFGWPPEYREMYANAAAAGYGDMARQWNAWGSHGAYPYHPHFAAQYAQQGFFGGSVYGGENWQHYQAASQAANRSRKRAQRKGDGEDFEDDGSGDGDGKRKQRKTRPNFSKDIIALLNQWILTHYDNPYPQKEVKLRMQEQTGLSELQLDNWFSNARRRLLVKDEVTKRYSIAQRAPKKRGPKTRKEDSDTEDAGTTQA